MPDALLLRRADLESVLDFPSTIAALNEAFRAESRGEWDTPRRIAARTAAGALLAMPCAGGAPAVLGAKLVTTFAGNTALALPTVAGVYALFDPATGGLLCLLDGAYLTLVRTAAVSALAARTLAREDARSMGVLGAGAQAGFHIRLIAHVRPIDRVTVWARKRDRAQALVDSLRRRDDLARIKTWTIAEEAGDAAGCDVVVSATSSAEPVLLGRFLSEGSLVIAMGAHTQSTREIDTEAVARAAFLAVETEGTIEEAGDFQIAEAEVGGVIGRARPLGSLLDPPSPPPIDPRSIRVFKSCGVAFEDLAVATLAFARAKERNLGLRFSFS